MIGNTNLRPALRGTRIYTYLAVDGGAGALELARLAGQQPTLRAVSSSRHADALLIVAPIAAPLLPAIKMLAQAMPPGGRILIFPTHAGQDETANMVVNALPSAQILSSLTPAAIAAALRAPVPPVALPDAPQIAEDLIDLPQEHEIATELAVLSLGPIQPFTAGPARFWLICDGEQVLECRIAVGYAARDIAGRMVANAWPEAAAVAAQLDPLAPIVSRLAFVRAIERLQGYTPPETTLLAREDALALERARNWLWWSVRLLRLLELAPLARQAQALAGALDAVCMQGVPEQHASLIPGSPFPAYHAEMQDALHACAHVAQTLAQRVRGDRWLRMRTAYIGVISAETAQKADISGPIFAAAQHGQGDVQARLLTRLTHTAAALNGVADRTHLTDDATTTSQGNWQVPAGEAHGRASGPRGDLSVRVVSDGGEHPVQVTWERPSAAALRLASVVLAGQKVADAEVILASLDLAMAEADG